MMNRVRQQQGFTLVEAILTAMITGIIALTVGNLLEIGVNAYVSVGNQQEGLARARLIADRTSREIRLLGSGTITDVMPTRLTFKDENNIQTTFELVGSNLYRGTDLLAEGINSLQFTYYDENRVTTLLPSKVRLMELSVGVQSPNGDVAVYRNLIFPRNFYYDNFQ